MAKWYVIGFNEDDGEESIDVASETWFADESKLKVRWPEETNKEFIKAVKKHTPPLPDWQLIDCYLQIEEGFGKYFIHQKLRFFKNFLYFRLI